MISGSPRRVELGSIDISSSGESVVFGLVAADREVLRMEMPSWTVHQLMRILPRLDAAMSHPGKAGLVAHPAIQWSAQPAGGDGAVALCVQSDRRVESAYLFDHADAVALHAALGQAIGGVSGRAGPISRVRSPAQALAAVASAWR